ncbi:MAG: restriction endonuclease subunit S [Deltaproteobacteria bacterium]|nr:restriction endonuclease subunit S [Deltaproteobacteria bacterium]
MLGNIPSDWQSKPLKALLSDHYPGDWGEERGPHMVKVLRSTNLTNNGHLDLSDIAERSLKPKTAELLAPRKNDILLERSGGGPDQPVGRVGFVESEMPGHAFSNFLHLLRPDPDCINPRFLGWALWRINQTGRILRLEQQTTQMRNLNFRDYLTMPLPVPPPEEQAAIAHVLDAVDIAIERTREAVERARVLANSLLHELLEGGIDEDGVVRSATDKHTQFQETDLGMLPKGWRVQRLSEVADVERGKFTPRPRNDPRFYDGLYPFVQTGLVAHAKGRVLYEYEQTLNDLGKSVSREFPAGTILVTIAANIGETAILGVPMCVPDSIVGVEVKKPNNPRFIEMCLRRHRPRLLALAPRSAQHNINLTTLRPLRLPVPPPEEQQRIAEIYDAADAQVRSYEVLESQYQQLKTALMHDLLTGKVRVNNLNLDRIAAA